jgi:hypothetical protein
VLGDASSMVCTRVELSLGTELFGSVVNADESVELSGILSSRVDLCFDESVTIADPGFKTAAVAELQHG